MTPQTVQNFPGQPCSTSSRYWRNGESICGRNQKPTRLDTTDIVDPAVASSIFCAEEKGIEHFKKFVADNLVQWSTQISDPIK